MTTVSDAMLTRNILKTYRGALPEHHAAGVRWYADAHRHARYLYPTDPDRGAGVIAALSPLTPWNRNLVLASMVSAGATRIPTLTSSARAALRIHAGTHWSKVLIGQKVRAFAAGIVASGATDEVCVDRHAADIAYGIPFTGTGHKRTRDSRVGIVEYRRIAAAYVRAGRRVGVDPAILQAITWTAHRGGAE